MKLIALVFLFLLSACGDSPLFNHDKESDNDVLNTSLTGASALKFSKSNYSFRIDWEVGPSMGESKFIMKTWKNNVGSENGPYQDLPNDLHIFLWMPSMGHGSAPVTITRVDSGEYEVSEVQFIMGGTWQIKFQLKEGAQVLDETVISVSL